MSKRLPIGALALAFVLASPVADAAGLWPLSYSQRHDPNGKPYSGAKAYFYDASTGDPITVYREYSLATPHANPVEADGNGVFPGVFIDGDEDFYRFRVTTATGAILSDDAVVPNIGPSEGEGGEPPEPVEASALAKTGDIKARYGTGTHFGWLPCNGLTVGSALSGANFASADNEALFIFLWQADDSLAVVGGRGATAAVDWAANKRLTLPDMRGRVLAGLDTMGNSASGVFTGLDALGEKLGGSVTLSAGQIPQLSLQSGVTSSGGLHGHPYRIAVASDDILNSAGGIALDATNPTNFPAYTGTPTDTTGQQIGGAGVHTHTVTGTVGSGSPTAVATNASSVGITFYIKK